MGLGELRGTNGEWRMTRKKWGAWVIDIGQLYSESVREPAAGQAISYIVQRNWHAQLPKAVNARNFFAELKRRTFTKLR